MKAKPFSEFIKELEERKKLHPIVHFFRYRFTSKHFWKSLWYRQVSSRIRPRNKWATKVIPRTFSDKDYIYEEIMFAGLIDFWDHDDGEKTLRYQWEHASVDGEAPDEERYDSYKEVYEGLKAAYDWAKVRQAKYDNLGTSWKEEQVLIETDTLHLSNLVKWRKYMWT